jgi:uncharacterized membrane protein YhaH (DUF805 family)
MAASRAERFRFLYREAEGVVDREVWRRASLPPLAIALGMTIVWLVIAPNGPRDLNSEAFIDLSVVATHLYALVYSFALVFCAVAEYFLSAKRFTDRGKPQALAGLLPLSLLLAGAANWFQPRSEGTMPVGLVYLFDGIAILILVWNIIELGFGESRRR